MLLWCLCGQPAPEISVVLKQHWREHCCNKKINRNNNCRVRDYNCSAGLGLENGILERGRRESSGVTGRCYKEWDFREPFCNDPSQHTAKIALAWRNLFVLYIYRKWIRRFDYSIPSCHIPNCKMQFSFSSLLQRCPRAASLIFPFITLQGELWENIRTLMCVCTRCFSLHLPLTFIADEY